jgi:short-subunit dehydrogenase
MAGRLPCRHGAAMKTPLTRNLGPALITGSSRGIGYYLAREFARHGHPLVLVAPKADELDTVATNLRREFEIEVRTIDADLTHADACGKVSTELGTAGIAIEYLVNNAGFGERGHFWEISHAKHIAMIRLNIEAVVRLTHLFLPAMLARGRGRILNTASIAGFEPGPNLAVYHATKAFVLSLSESLATELKDTGVTVTALCPGATDTDFFEKAHMVDTNAFQNQPVMAPQQVAEAGYAALMKGERTVVPGGMNKAIIAARRLLPESTQAKKNEKLYEETRPAERKRERGEIENAEALRQL